MSGGYKAQDSGLYGTVNESIIVSETYLFTTRDALRKRW
jgi:hypothetical protein